MPVITSCPRCGKKYRLKGSATEGIMHCRGCDKPFRVSASDNEFAEEPTNEPANNVADDFPNDFASDFADEPADDAVLPSLPALKKKSKKKGAAGGKKVVVNCLGCGIRFEAPFRQTFYETPCLACNQPVPVPGKDGSVGPPGEEPAETTDKPKKPSGARSQKQFNPVIPLVIGGVFVIGIVGLLFFLPSMSSKKSDIQVPEEEDYLLYIDKIAQEFRVKYPPGWKVESGGRGTSNPWARFTKGSATIRIKTSMGASALGSMMNPVGVDDGETPDELSPVAGIHTFMKDQFAENYSGYEEQPAITIKTGFGDGRMSEFTAKGSWGSKTKGIRLSCLGIRYQFTLMGDCPEADWAACKPIFEFVAESLSN